MTGKTLALALALSLSLFATHALAQSARVSMTSTATQVAVGQAFQLQIRADVSGANLDEIRPPNLSAFEIRGQSMRRPMQISFGGTGQPMMVESTTTQAYTLVPHSPGTFELESAIVVVGGQEFRSEPLTITVTGQGQSAAPNGQPVPQLQQAQQNGFRAPTGQTVAAEAMQVDPQAFVRTTVDVDNPYLGQQVTVSVYLYTRDILRATPRVLREPSTDGFWVQDLLPPQRTMRPRTRQMENGVYREYLIKRFAAFPVREGELTLGGAEFEITVGGGLGLFTSPQQIRRAGTDLQLRSRPLPEHTGPVEPVVGEFALEGTLDRAQVRTGDALTLTMTVRGEGNVQDIRLPKPRVEGLQILDPTMDDSVEVVQERVRGQRRFEWIIVPQRPGTFELPVFRLPVVNPSTGAIRTVDGPSLTLTAAGNAIATDPAEEPAEELPERDDGDDLVPDFPPPEPESALLRGSAPVSSSWWFWALLALGPILYFGHSIQRSAKRRNAGKPKTVKGGKRLQRAKQLASQGDSSAFYGEVASALKGAASDALGEPAQGLTHSALQQALSKAGIASGAAKALVEVLEACDFARFSSGAASADEQGKLLARAEEIVRALEQSA